MNVQVRLSQQALEFAVLQFELAQPFGLCRIHAAVLGAPFVEAGIPASACLKKTNDLLFAVFAWFACPSFSIVTDFLEK